MFLIHLFKIFYDKIEMGLKMRFFIYLSAILSMIALYFKLNFIASLFSYLVLVGFMLSFFSIVGETYDEGNKKQ